jgi:Tol biopolymer transport system component
MSIYFSSNRNGISQLFKAHRNNLTENFSNLEQLSFFDSPGAALSGPMISNNGTEFYFSKSINGSPWDMYVSYIPEPGSICLFFSGIFILKIKNKYYQR